MNDMMTYSISYSNISGAISNYSIWDTIPAQMNVSSISSGGNINGNVINWNFATLGAGQNGVVSWVGIITASSGTVMNTAMDNQGTMSSAAFTICSPTTTFTPATTLTVTPTITQTTTLPPTTATFTPTITVTSTLVVEPTQPTEEMPCGTITLFQNIIYPEEGKFLSIHYSLYMQMAVVVKIYNRNGTLVKTIADDQESGDMNISWDGTNDSGQTVSSGIYLLYVKLGHCERREKIAIIR